MTDEVRQASIYRLRDDGVVEAKPHPRNEPVPKGWTLLTDGGQQPEDYDALAAERDQQAVTIENLASDVVTLEAERDELERLAKAMCGELGECLKEIEAQYENPEDSNQFAEDWPEAIAAFTAYQRKHRKET